MPHDFPRPQDARGPLAVARGEVLELVQGTAVEDVIALPIDPALEVGALIRMIVFDVFSGDVVIPAADVSDTGTIDGSLTTRQGLAGPPTLATAGTLAVVKQQHFVTSQVGDTGVSQSVILQGGLWTFRPSGLLVSTQNLSLWIDTVSMNTVSAIRVAIFFQVVTITPSDLLAAISTISDIS